MPSFTEDTKMWREPEERPPRLYYVGRYARLQNKRKSPPGYLAPVDRYWWLAGWNDADIELDGGVNYADAE